MKAVILTIPTLREFLKFGKTFPLAFHSAVHVAILMGRWATRPLQSLSISWAGSSLSHPQHSGVKVGLCTLKMTCKKDFNVFLPFIPKCSTASFRQNWEGRTDGIKESGEKNLAHNF